jgi:DNA repair exonuclease SbcCD ATPase subunit
VVDLYPFNLAFASMKLRSFFLAALLLTLGACTALPLEYQAVLSQGDAGAPALLGELARVDGLTPEQRRRELAELEGMRRLDAARRFQLAALLEREDSTESLERSLKILNNLAEPDARTEALLKLMKASLRSRIELKQQTARAQELQGKLEQIKALEKSLQQRNGTSKTP